MLLTVESKYGPTAHADLLEFYEEFYRQGDWAYADEGLGRRLVASVVHKANKSCRGARVLDLGCGTGYHAKLLAQQAARVVGLDFSMQALRAARKRSPIPVVRADARRLCFAEDAFDIVFCSGLSLFNTDDLERIRRLFAYYQRYLRPGGVILFLSASEFTGRLSKDSDWMNHRWEDVRRFVNGPHVGPFVFHPRIVRILGAASFNPAVTGALRAVNVFLRRRVPFLMIVPDLHGAG